MLRRLAQTSLIALTVLALAAPSAFAETAEGKKKKLRAMRDQALKDLYEERPDVESIVNDAPGYAVFSNVGVNVIFVSAGGGNGLVVEQDGTETFMRMGEIGVGIGLGVKDFRAVFVFRNEETLRAFVDEGWEFSADADAAAKSNDKGGEASATGNIDSANNGLLVYQFTENGVALQAGVSGTKYWKDGKLNQ